MIPNEDLPPFAHRPMRQHWPASGNETYRISARMGIDAKE
jgi:hypothetical protein